METHFFDDLFEFLVFVVNVGKISSSSSQSRRKNSKIHRYGLFFGRSKLAKFLMRLLIVILNKLVRIITRRDRLVSKTALGDHLVGFFCVTGSIFSLVGGALGYHSSFFILHSFLFQGVRVRGKG